jgi:hypothetical protein
MIGGNFNENILEGIESQSPFGSFHFYDYKIRNGSLQWINNTVLSPENIHGKALPEALFILYIAELSPSTTIQFNVSNFQESRTLYLYQFTYHAKAQILTMPISSNALIYYTRYL